MRKKYATAHFPRRNIRSNDVHKTCSETVIPVKTGIQKNRVHASRLDSGVRRNDDIEGFRTSR